MTIKTILYFAFGGTFSALYANKVRGFHFLRKPQYHLLCTAIGALVGYKMHLIEENFDKLVLKSKAENPLGVIYPREHLLAYQEMVRRKQAQSTITDDEGEENENFDITEEEEDDE